MFSRDGNLVLKHILILNLVEFGSCDKKRVPYTQLKYSSINSDAWNNTNIRLIHTPHIPFVDNSLIMNMIIVMIASIEASFIIIGNLN